MNGNPVYHACVYDDSEALVGQLTLDTAGAICALDGRPCWRETPAGWIYLDSWGRASDFRKANLKRERIVLKARNRPEEPTSRFPVGLAFGLSGAESARLQFRVDDEACFDVELSRVGKADGQVFKGRSD